VASRAASTSTEPTRNASTAITQIQRFRVDLPQLTLTVMSARRKLADAGYMCHHKCVSAGHVLHERPVCDSVRSDPLH